MSLVFFYHAEKVVYEVKVRARLGLSDNDDDDDEKGRYRHDSVVVVMNKEKSIFKVLDVTDAICIRL